MCTREPRAGALAHQRGWLERLSLLPSGDYPTTYATELLAYENTFGDNPAEERSYATRWAQSYPESYVPACRAALGPR